MSGLEKKLADKLLEENIFSEKEINEAVNKARNEGVDLYVYLLEQSAVDKEKLLSCMSGVSKIPFVNLHEVKIDGEAIKAVPAKFAWYYKFIPIKKEKNKLTIATDRPLSTNAHDELKTILDYDLDVVLAKNDQVAELLKRHYGLAADTIDKMVERDGKISGDKSAFDLAEMEDIEKLAGDASVVRLVNQIILDAYNKRATDIHIEPLARGLKLRYRIDGVLQVQNVPEDVNHFILPILSRIKIMSNLNIVERRVPQDGRAVVRTQNEVLDLRVSFMPTPHGESVVIRMLPKKMYFNLKKLGLSEENQNLFKKLIKKPSGIVFITGPTGSGKTTTLYACLQEVDRKCKKIITIEDPIEYGIEDVTQIQVNESTGLTFAKGLRSVLRHDPDIIMVGEVRDKETAEIATRVSLTGHLVFSTLHTNDASTGVTRLIDIGIEPYLVASSVEAFIAQRLVRTICPNCKEIDADPQNSGIINNIGQVLNVANPEQINLYKGRGCEKCNFTGFFGRTAIYEILVVDHEIKQLIAQKIPASEIKNKAVENGMKTLIESGWEKVIQGITTPGEVLNVCQDLEVQADYGHNRAADPDKKTADVTIPDGKVISQSYKDSNRTDEKRIYTRLSACIPLKYRLIEKGQGEIVKIKQPIPGEMTAPEEGFDPRNDDKLFAEYIFTKQISAGKSELEELEKEISTTTVNISAGGLVFDSEYMIPVDSIVEIKLAIPKEKEPAECLARIIRPAVLKVKDDVPHSFNIPVCFLDVSSKDRAVIDKFVHEQTQKQKMLDVEIY